LTAINIATYIKVAKVIITLITIPNSTLTIFKIAIDIVSLVLARFVARTVVVLRSTYYKNKSKRETILNTRIAIDF